MILVSNLGATAETNGMDKNLLVLLLWMLTGYCLRCDANSRSKPKREEITTETEPHPYTISFFTFPKGAASQLLKPKRESKRDDQDLSSHQKIKQVITEKETKKEVKSPASDVSKKSKASSKVSKTKTIKIAKEQKENKRHYQPKEKSTVLKKGANIKDNDLRRGRNKVQPVEPWRLGASHNKIQYHQHHAVNTEETESYQEGSIKQPSHTMYPKCHQCPSNSSYEDCASKSTLKKCDSGLNNICYTKSFYSNARGIIYEMGCSNHEKCQKAMATPCKGAMKKCFVCCQFDECNAQEHHYFQSSKTNDDDNLGYSAFSKATRTCELTGNAMLFLSLPLVAWMLT